ncbi:MAG: endolytic transglycosylase MltG [Muribaculum sp.]|nr:endolytic transglycosylase MltG [Muribaculaceae bacterium]MCM1080124.1 endolytic transglycosylase MltG [Muribaculum sp.]
MQNISESKTGKRLTIILIMLLLVVAAGMFTWSSITNTDYTGEQPAWVYIPAGSDFEQISDSLSKSLGKAGVNAATIWKLTGGKTSRAHGAFKIEKGTSALSIYRTISRGRQTPVRVTFNNIRTMPQLYARLSTQIEADSLAIATAADSSLSANGLAKEQYIGAFMPDTYEFYWTDSPQKVIDKIHSHQKAFWNPERTLKAADLGLTPEQVITIASIAEEETNNAAERATVGRLYINRLKHGMRLQADPTVKFAVGDFALRRITGKHLEVKSPYNTYLNEGLPPGPIRMPDARTIDAILDSAPNNYIYMCAREDMSGLHNFTASAQQHMQNAARYRAALNRRGIH